MRKIYAALFVTLICFNLANAQRIFSGKMPVSKIPSSHIPGISGTTSDCDTSNFQNALNDWNLTYYITGTNGADGYVAGTNKYGDKQKANYFDLSSTTYSYTTGCLFYFAKANSNKSGELSKNIIFRVYGVGTDGNPSTQLGDSVAVPLSQIKSDVAGNFLTQIIFSTPIALPASKQFFVSVDLSNFKWQTTISGTRDSITLVTSQDGDVNPGEGYEQWSDASWHDMNSAWQGFNVGLGIFPYVSNTAAGCTALPVKLLSFNAERKSNDVTLSWKISNELNMKQYELERADNNGNFKTVATVKPLNSLKDQSYTVTDKNAFNLAASVQYRLKQVDGDGSVNYSRVVTVKSTAVITDVTFANPFNGSLKLQLNLAASQLVSVSLYDMQGKLVASEKPAMYNASANTIILNSTANLKSGLYVLKLNAGTEQAVYKVVKQ